MDEDDTSVHNNLNDEDEDEDEQEEEHEDELCEDNVVLQTPQEICPLQNSMGR